MNRNQTFSVEQQNRFGKPINSLLISVPFATDNSVFINELIRCFPTARISPKWGNCSVLMQFSTIDSCSDAKSEITEILSNRLSEVL